jgi:DNA-binding CsgD family transcriptional regulator
VRTLSIFIFILFFFLAGFAVFLADRLFRHHRHSSLQTYTLHLAFWNGHAMVMIMQHILGSVFLPNDAMTALAMATGPLTILFLAIGLYFLVLFVVQLSGKNLFRAFSVFYLIPWGVLLLIFAFTAGKQPLTPPVTFPRTLSLVSGLLKIGTVLFAVTYLLFQGAKSDDSFKRLYFRRIAWTYLAGFLFFQLSVIWLFPVFSLPVSDYIIAFFQIGYHFPVLVVLSRFLNRQAVARPPLSPQIDLAKQLSGFNISQREAEIISLILRGLSNKDIGDNLFISLETVKKHVSNIYKKLGVKNRLQLSFFIQNRLGLPPSDL